MFLVRQERKQLRTVQTTDNNSAYLFFASSLIGLNRSLEGIRAFGTDGEQALIDAFNHEFGFLQHLTCFIYVRRNIKEKLNNCNPPVLSKLVLNDIFGRRFGTVFEEGLVDSDDNDNFQVKLQAILKKWHSSEISSSADMDGFIHWFMANKVDVIQNTMLRPIRVEYGLGNPPEIFTTNSSESINALLKNKKKGNIAKCFGCHNRYPKSPQPPFDLCIKHQE